MALSPSASLSAAAKDCVEYGPPRKGSPTARVGGCLFSVGFSPTMFWDGSEGDTEAVAPSRPYWAGPLILGTGCREAVGQGLSWGPGVSWPVLPPCPSGQSPCFFICQSPAQWLPPHAHNGLSLGAGSPAHLQPASKICGPMVMVTLGHPGSGSPHSCSQPAVSCAARQASLPVRVAPRGGAQVSLGGVPRKI